MQQSLRLWKRQRREAGPCQGPVLREGVRLGLAEQRPDALRAIMDDLTFVPRQTYDKGAAPQPVRCYVAEEASLLVPRCYPLAEPPEDHLCDGAAMTCAFAGTLNPVQQTASERTLACVQQAPHAAMLVLPCGFGKTVVGLQLAAALGRRTLVVVHKDFLMQQWLERVGTFLPTARTGVIQQGRCEHEADVVLAMLQTLCARELPPTVLESFGTVILDEAHHLAAPYFSQLFFKLPTRHIVGLTATPRRKDGCTDVLHLFMGPFSFQLSARVGDGLTVQRVRWRSALSCRPDPDPAEVQRLKTRLTKDGRRNAFLTSLCAEAVDAGRQVLLLSERVGHLRDLRGRFAALRPEAKVALYVGGRDRANLAERRIAETEAALVLGTFAMSQEGLDIPRLDSLILATPVGDVTQAVGRILRPCDAKQAPVVVDVVDEGCVAFGRLAQVRRGCYERSSFAVTDCDVASFA